MSERTDRDRVVEEAALALLDLTPQDLLSAVGVREICRRAGISPPTLYRQFGSLGGLATAVVAHVFDPDRTIAVEETQKVADIPAAPLPMEGGLALHRAEFERTRADLALRLRLGLWGLGGESAAQAYGDLLREVERRVAEVVPAMLSTWGREVREPFDVQTFLALHVAFLNGAAVRGMVDEDAVSADDFARAALSLTRVLLKLEGDRRTVDDRLAEINYFPLADRGGRRLTDRGRLTRAQVLDAAAELFGQRELRRISLADLARQARVSRSTVYALFDDVQDVAVQLFLAQVGDVLDPASSDDLRTILQRLAEAVLLRLPHAEAYAQRLASARALPDDVVVAAVQARMGVPDVDRATAAVLVLVRQLVARPSAGPDEAVAVASAVLGV